MGNLKRPWKKSRKLVEFEQLKRVQTYNQFVMFHSSQFVAISMFQLIILVTVSNPFNNHNYYC